MRHIRLTAVLAVAVCAFAAAAATPALAHEFKASATGKTKGVTEEEQFLTFKPFKITCLKASTKGTATEGSSQTLNTTVKFLKCTAAAKFEGKGFPVAVTFTTPVNFEYHANGFVETGSETEEVEGKVVLSGGTISLKVNAGPKFKCTINWPEQTIPVRAEKRPDLEYSAAVYSNQEPIPKKKSPKFPDGFQHKINIANEFKGIQFEFEGEPCETWGKEESSEGKTGKYLGEFPEELVGGNLEFF